MEAPPVDSKKPVKSGLVPLSDIAVASLALGSIVFYFILGPIGFREYRNIPLITALVIGGSLVLFRIGKELLQGRYGTDLLAAISIIAASLSGEYLVGVIVVLMLSGGETLELYSAKKASSVLEALSQRMPTTVHLVKGKEILTSTLQQIALGDIVAIFPHEICPVDGVVVEGHGNMDESYLTGEPFMLSKTPGSSVFSGAINGENVLNVKAEKLPIDSRYSRIMKVMESSIQSKPHMRRLAEKLGAFYTPLALIIAFFAYYISSDFHRFLAVVVVATPCPLIIAIPVCIVGAISACAKRSIIIKDPAALEKIGQCRTIIFDKTGTLTYGRPKLSAISVASGQSEDRILQLVASAEQYSRHPLAHAIISAAEEKKIELLIAEQLREPPGQGLVAQVAGLEVQLTSRKYVTNSFPDQAALLPQNEGGLECIVLVNKAYAGVLRFRDEPRNESKPFISHLGPLHQINRVILLSGDRESEVRYLASLVGISEVFYGKTPEEKVAIVKEENAKQPTAYVGDGINDAPSLKEASVGIAFGQQTDITSEAADVVVMDSSLEKVDQFFHLAAHMKKIALQSAVGGMLVSIVAMLFATVGLLTPLAGAILQEVVDVASVLNSLRVSKAPAVVSDFEEKSSLAPL